jgi:hypothetical protein
LLHYRFVIVEYVGFEINFRTAAATGVSYVPCCVLAIEQRIVDDDAESGITT